MARTARSPSPNAPRPQVPTPAPASFLSFSPSTPASMARNPRPRAHDLLRCPSAARAHDRRASLARALCFTSTGRRREKGSPKSSTPPSQRRTLVVRIQPPSQPCRSPRDPTSARAPSPSSPGSPPSASASSTAPSSSSRRGGRSGFAAMPTTSIWWTRPPSGGRDLIAMVMGVASLVSPLAGPDRRGPGLARLPRPAVGRTCSTESPSSLSGTSRCRCPRPVRFSEFLERMEGQQQSL